MKTITIPAKTYTVFDLIEKHYDKLSKTDKQMLEKMARRILTKLERQS